MLNQVLNVVIESEVEGRKYSLHLPMGAPIGETYDQCHAFLQAIVKMGEDAAAVAKRASENKE